MSIVVASVSVSLSGDAVAEEKASAKAEVCGSGHKVGDIVGIKVFLPLGFIVHEVFSSVSTIGGSRVVYASKADFPIEEFLKIGEGTDAQLGYVPKGTVSGQWIGNSLGVVRVVGGNASIAKADPTNPTQIICPVPTSVSNALIEFKRTGIWKASYKSEALIYHFYSPNAAALAQFGLPPYPVNIQFLCIKA